MPTLPRKPLRDSDEPSPRYLTEFDCPECSANNPYEDGIHSGDEVRCYYCGAGFRAEVNDSGRWRFREV